jgi:hypothetical protein
MKNKKAGAAPAAVGVKQGLRNIFLLVNRNNYEVTSFKL